MEGVKHKLPKAVIFDWDGTLVDTIPGLRIAHNHVRTTMGYEPWTEAQFWENLKHSARELYPRVYGAQSDKALGILYEYVDNNHLKYLKVLPHAQEVLNFLDRNRIPYGLISNKRHEYLLKEVSHIGWEKRFFAAIGAGIAARDKPAADPVHKIFELGCISFAPDDVWFIGDTETDLATGQAFGCPTILITHGRDMKGLIETYKPLHVVASCEELLAFFPDDTEKKACCNAAN
jgi:phosphoglycolate phosphatase